MNSAELKLEIFRFIDRQEDSLLEEIHQILIQRFPTYIASEHISDLEIGYREMASDVEREKEAEEWIENTLNAEEL